MIDAMWNGISGLNVFQKALNSESNNVANTNTIAFKSDKVTFSDLMYQNGYGRGTNIINSVKDFSQGSITITSNPYDLAILGDGFFTVQDTYGSTFYTRSGNFKMSNDGLLRTENNEAVMGVSIDAPIVKTTNSAVTTFNDNYSKLIGSQAIDNSIALRSINAKSTNYETSAIQTGSTGQNLKSSSANVHDVEELTAAYKEALTAYATDLTGTGTASTTQQTVASFDVSMITQPTDILTIFVDNIQYKQIFDTNTATTLNNLSDQLSNIPGIECFADTTTGELTINSLVPGKNVNIGGANINENAMSTVNTKEANKGTGSAAYESIRDALSTALVKAKADFLEIIDNVNLSSGQSLNLTSLQLRPDLLGISDSAFGTIDVVGGAIYRTQDTNRFLLGKVVTSVFDNNLALEAVGSNKYKETTTSGKPYHSNGANTIRSKAIEVSNSDLSKSLTNLMVYQRAFEANSKTITTSDEFLKTAIQLKS